MRTSRRGWLKSAAGIAGSAALARSSPAALPAVSLGDYEVTRLICGANPFGGYSHFNRLFDQHMKEWMTQERILETLRRCEQNGVNTWQFHYGEQTIAAIKKLRAEGSKLQFLVLSEGELKRNYALIDEVARLKPIGIVHHGGVTDQRFRAGEMGKVQEFLKRVRASGVMVGLSMHNPLVMEYVEEKGWDIDFYMTCFYHVSRTPEEARKMLGKLPLGESFLEDDPVEMTRRVRQTKKTCLGFKILAAGRVTDTPEQVQNAFRFAFENIKPQDAVIVGMYPRFRDEPKENADYVRRFGARPT